MRTIPTEEIGQVWDRLCQASQRESEKMARQMQQRQPYLMVYLLAMDEQIMDEDERGRLMELGALIWETMSAAQPDFRIVTGEELEAAEEANLQMLERLDEDSEMHQVDSVKKLFLNYNQSPLLGVMVELLMAGHEDAPELAPLNTGMALIYLKTVIDCLDR